MIQRSLFDEDWVSLPEKVGNVSLALHEKAQVLTRTGGALKGFDYSLNPYIGCGFGCSYCYAAFFQLPGERREAWGSWVEAKVDAVRQIARSRRLAHKRILMSSATDPYQPIEAKLGLTRQVLEALLGLPEPPRLVVQTRGPLVTRDLDLLKRFPEVRVNMSVTTDDEAVRKAFEPSCASLDRRIEALWTLKRAGLRIGVCCSPLLPMRDPESWARRIRALEPDHCSISPFHQTDRPFTANTRPEAWVIAERFGWDRRHYLETAACLRKLLASPW